MARFSELDTTLVTKWGSSAIVNRLGHIRRELFVPNVEVLASLATSSTPRLGIISSGAERLGARLLREDRAYMRSAHEFIKDIETEYAGDKEELARRKAGFAQAQERERHRRGQQRLELEWGHEFARHGVKVSWVLLDGQKRDFTIDIQLAAGRDEVIIFNGNGALDPTGAPDNDKNTLSVVSWVEPEDSQRQLYVLGVTNPNTRGLLDRHGNTINAYTGGIIERVARRSISNGGPETKASTFHGIKKAHPRAVVGVSANSPEILHEILLGKADTLFELKHH